MEVPILRLIHILSGIVWAGGAIAVGWFVIPSVADAGPAGGAVMRGIAARRFPQIITVAGFLTVLAGLRLYWLKYTAAWLGTPEGVMLSIGMLLGISALSIGVFVQRPTAGRLAALAATVGASGGPPNAEQAAEMQALS